MLDGPGQYENKMSMPLSMPTLWQAIVVCTKKAPFGKAFCLGRTGPGFVYNFMNGRAMGAVGLDQCWANKFLKSLHMV